MNAIEKDLLKEQRDQKNIANQARYRKGSRGGKGCNLPSDNLTKKEREAKNGPTYVYQTDKPMSYEEFKVLPKYLQEMYIHHLQTKYGVTYGTIAVEMFRIRKQSLRSYFTLKNITYKVFGKGYRMNQKQKDQWATFLIDQKDVKPITETNSEQQEIITEEPVENVYTIVQQQAKPATKMTSLTMNFTGAIDPDAIANSLRHLFGTDSVGDIRIEVTIKEDI